MNKENHLSKLLKYENAKLKQQFIFNLPATKQVCGRVCPGCYAIKAQVRFPKTVLASRERLFVASNSDTFVPTIISELQSTRRAARTVRIHESGEFHSQEYLNKWEEIALACPDFTFYAFTKRKRDFDFSKLTALPNVSIIDSLHFGRLNYGLASETPSGAFVCPATATKDVVCGVTCRYCMTKGKADTNGIWFNKH